MNAKQQLHLILEHYRFAIPTMARKMNISKSTLYSIEKGSGDSISPRTAKIICDVFDDVDYLRLVNGENPIIPLNTTKNLKEPNPQLTELALDTLDNWEDLKKIKVFKNQLVIEKSNDLNRILLEVVGLLDKMEDKKISKEGVKEELLKIVSA